ncbi:MAG TPA: hypothetical protein ENI86_03730 [Acidimicrobiales bacterium]|nr:hypothetical protein [Acidimicrobiales bacterium]
MASTVSPAAAGTEPAPRVLVDPTSEKVPAARTRPEPLESITGRTIGLLDISKARGNLLLDRVQQHLEGRGAKVIRFRKPTFAKPAPVDLRHEIATQCEAVIEALAD